MLARLKKLNGEAILEVAVGVIAAIMFLRLLSVIFGRQSLGTMFGAENAEDLENLGGRGKARRAGRQAYRTSKRATKQYNKDVLTKRAIEQGKKRGSAGRIEEEEEEEPQFQPSEEEMQEMLETAEYFESLSKEDIDDMSDAEYAEYLDYMENVRNAE